MTFLELESIVVEKEDDGSILDKIVAVSPALVMVASRRYFFHVGKINVVFYA